MGSYEALMADLKSPITQVELQEIPEFGKRTPLARSNTFFKWIQDFESRKPAILDDKTFPWKGVFALAISVLTTFGALGLLFWLDHRHELVPTTGVYRFMQPASWVSALMSVNAAALHIALSEGVTIAWWYHATRPTATLQQLHVLWDTGMSSYSAAAQLRNLSYVSLATLFVAILPLNSFLLQGAITTPLTMVQKHVNVPVPSVRRLPLGYSGVWRDDNSTRGRISTIGAGQWQTTFLQVKNIAGSKYAKYAYIGAYDQCDKNATTCTDTWAAYNRTPTDDHLLANRYYDNDTLSTFAFKMQGVGFDVICEKSTKPYDLVPSESDPIKSDAIFYTDVDWDHDNPNVITLEMWWKPDSSCVGEYEYRFCNLTAATVEYPVEMSLDVSKVYRGPYFSLATNSTRQDDKVIQILEKYSNDSQSTSNRTTFGGIAHKYDEWYSSNITLTTRYNNGYSVRTDGPVAYGIGAAWWDSDDAGEGCAIDMSSGLSAINYFAQLTNLTKDPSVEFGPYTFNGIGDPTDLILNQIRQSMFLASIYDGAGYWARSFSRKASSPHGNFRRPESDEDFIQHVNALKTKYVPTYKIRWELYGASVLMTYTLIGMILPTFWGFWVLKARPTLSPVDVARALSAPILDHDYQNQMPVEALLKEVGQKNIHRDLHPIRDSSPWNSQVAIIRPC